MKVTAFLIKYGEIAIKGKNRYMFEDALMKQIRHAMAPVGDFKVRKESGRMFVEAQDEFDYDEAVEALHPDGIQYPKTGRVCKLGFNEDGSVYADGTPQEMNTYYMYEDSEINQFNGLYYYSYCSNFRVPDGDEKDKWITPGSICVYVSSDPMNIAFDPVSASADKFKDEDGTYHHYLGTILDNPSTIYGQFYNNHHHMQSFKGHNYILCIFTISYFNLYFSYIFFLGIIITIIKIINISYFIYSITNIIIFYKFTYRRFFPYYNRKSCGHITR